MTVQFINSFPFKCISNILVLFFLLHSPSKSTTDGLTIQNHFNYHLHLRSASRSTSDTTIGTKHHPHRRSIPLASQTKQLHIHDDARGVLCCMSSSMAEVVERGESKGASTTTSTTQTGTTTTVTALHTSDCRWMSYLCKCQMPNVIGIKCCYQIKVIF